MHVYGLSTAGPAKKSLEKYERLLTITDDVRNRTAEHPKESSRPFYDQHAVPQQEVLTTSLGREGRINLIEVKSKKELENSA